MGLPSVFYFIILSFNFLKLLLFTDSPYLSNTVFLPLKVITLSQVIDYTKF